MGAAATMAVLMATGFARAQDASPESGDPRGQPHVPEGYQSAPSPPPPPPPSRGRRPPPATRSPAPPEPEPGPEPERKRRSITLDPLGLVTGFFNLQFENAPLDWLSWYAGPSVLLIDDIYVDVKRAYGLDVGLRFFPIGGGAVEGFWIGPQAGVAYTEYETPFGDEGQGVAWLVAATIGYTFVWGSFVLSLGGGFGVFIAEEEIGGEEIGYVGPAYLSRGALGFAF